MAQEKLKEKTTDSKSAINASAAPTFVKRRATQRANGARATEARLNHAQQRYHTAFTLGEAARRVLRPRKPERTAQLAVVSSPSYFQKVTRGVRVGDGLFAAAMGVQALLVRHATHVR